MGADDVIPPSFDQRSQSHGWRTDPPAERSSAMDGECLPARKRSNLIGMDDVAVPDALTSEVGLQVSPTGS